MRIEALQCLLRRRTCLYLLSNTEDFSNGCQLRALDWCAGEAQLSIDEAQERGLAHACTRSRDCTVQGQVLDASDAWGDEFLRCAIVGFVC